MLKGDQTGEKPMWADHGGIAYDERERVIKSQKEMLVKRLAQASPPINEVCSKILLEFSKHEVNIGSIKSSVARIQRVAAGFDKIGAAIAANANKLASSLADGLSRFRLRATSRASASASALPEKDKMQFFHV